MDKEEMREAITKVVNKEQYTLKQLETVSMFLQDLGRERWPDMWSDIFVLGEFIEEIKDSVFEDK